MYRPNSTRRGGRLVFGLVPFFMARNYAARNGSSSRFSSSDEVPIRLPRIRLHSFDHTQLGVTMYAGLMIQGNIGSSQRIEYAEVLRDTNNWSMIATVTLDRTP
jgi:hypothetical protein